MNLSEANKIVAILRKVFPEQKVDAGLDAVWEMVFEDVPYEAVRMTVAEFLRADERFFPKPGQIRSLLIESLMGLPSPEEAWAEVMREIKEHGIYRAPIFSCAAVANAVDAIGWRNICLSEEIGVERAHFFRTYQAYRDRAVKHVDMPSLIAGRYHEIDASNPVNHVPTPITAKNGDPF